MRSVVIAGASSVARLCWARAREGEGVSSKCWGGVSCAVCCLLSGYPRLVDLGVRGWDGTGTGGGWMGGRRGLGKENIHE